jgi:hypothetical protein
MKHPNIQSKGIIYTLSAVIALLALIQSFLILVTPENYPFSFNPLKAPFFWLFLFGSLGGLLKGLSDAKGYITMPHVDHDNQTKFHLGYFGDLLFGAAGSMVIFILFPGEIKYSSFSEIVKISGLAIVGGYGAHILMVKVLKNTLAEDVKQHNEKLKKVQEVEAEQTQRIEQLQLLDAEKKQRIEQLQEVNTRHTETIDRQEKQIENLISNFQKRFEEVMLEEELGTEKQAALAFSYLNTKDARQKCFESIHKLNQVISKSPKFQKDRELNFALSRKYKEVDQYLDAIGTMVNFRTILEREDSKNFRDLADIEYNLGCYFSLAGEFNIAENALKESKKAFRKSIEMYGDHFPGELEEHKALIKERETDLDNNFGRRVRDALIEESII